MSIKYNGSFAYVTSDLSRWARIQSFSAGHAKPIIIESSTDTAILAALGQAKTGKSITLFKSPTKDDFDAVLLGLAGNKTPFGFNFDISIVYPGSTIKIVHFFAEDATLSSTPVNVGSHKTLALKIEVDVEHVDLKHNFKVQGIYEDDDGWNA